MVDEKRIQEIDAEIAELDRLSQDTDEASFEAKEERICELLLERARELGCTEAELDKINAEVEAEAWAEHLKSATFSRSRAPTRKMLRKRAREQGYTEAEIDRIFADTSAEVGKMTDLEISAEVLEIAKNTVRADPNAIHDRQVLEAILTHVRNLLREDEDVQATFKALLKPREVVWFIEDSSYFHRASTARRAWKQLPDALDKTVVPTIS
jgi:hypothetical protein